MDYKEHITAKWARETSQTILGEKVKKQVKTCLDAIELAVDKNEKNVSVSMYVEDLTKRELEKRGFTVREYDGDYRDPRETSYITINW